MLQGDVDLTTPEAIPKHSEITGKFFKKIDRGTREFFEQVEEIGRLVFVRDQFDREGLTDLNKIQCGIEITSNGFDL